MARFTQYDLVYLRQQSALHIPVMPIKRPFDHMRAWLHQPTALQSFRCLVFLDHGREVARVVRPADADAMRQALAQITTA